MKIWLKIQSGSKINWKNICWKIIWMMEKEEEEKEIEKLNSNKFILKGIKNQIISYLHMLLLQLQRNKFQNKINNRCNSSKSLIYSRDHIHNKNKIQCLINKNRIHKSQIMKNKNNNKLNIYNNTKTFWKIIFFQLLKWKKLKNL